MLDNELAESDRKLAERQFKKDVMKHVRDVAEKYIIPGVTSDGAVLFIPAEAVFAEIQAHHTDVVQFANNARVWLVSPTTLWAILNTARAVLKDAATREQVHIIQEHLGYLSKDFDRFRKRMDNLGKHVAMAHKDVQEVHTTAEKITTRFEKIEKVELDHINTRLVDVDQNE
jgi:DNA recombination protein RmuC